MLRAEARRAEERMWSRTPEEAGTQEKFSSHSPFPIISVLDQVAGIDRSLAVKSRLL